MKIYGQLAKIQQELKAPKNLYNKFGNYNYRNAEGILAAVKPLLNGLALIVNDEPMMIGELQRHHSEMCVICSSLVSLVGASGFSSQPPSIPTRVGQGMFQWPGRLNGCQRRILTMVSRTPMAQTAILLVPE